MKEVALPVVLVSAVGVMILPLPGEVLDLLLVCNLALSLLLLISSVFVRTPERFTVLPSLLLFSTLFRLSLNISTTRQLLGEGSAPELVEAFGRIVVGGSIAVGGVIFLVVTVVQFVVIAKGAERVAEVSARFALDAMPGRQMAIDADLRSGVITLSEARERRYELQSECKLFGALDGAMKFVKGDAIAGILITIINIIAGFAVGVLIHGMSFSEAVRKYTLFTIGDGLASQLPALLVAVAAGVVVTRVSGVEGALLSTEIISQLSEEPRTLRVGGILIGALGFVPGFPTVSLLVLSGGLLFASRRGKGANEGSVAGFQPYTAPPLLFSCSLQCAQTLQSEGTLAGELHGLRKRVFTRFGVILPEPSFEIAERGGGAECRISIHGAAIAKLGPLTSPSTLEIMGAIQSELEANLSLLLDDTHTRLLFELYDSESGDLINTVAGTPQELTLITWILRRLVEEGVPIIEVRNILQAVANCKASGVVDREEVLSQVRRAVRGTITGLVGESREVWGVSVELEELLWQLTVARTPIDPVFAERVCAAVPRSQNTRIVLCSPRVREILWRILSPLKERLFVLSPEEILPQKVVSLSGELSISALPLSPPSVVELGVGSV